MAKSIDTAFVLAAGYGKRLAPLTDMLPKPLLPVNGKPMLCHIFDKLTEAGISRIFVNTHHLAGEYEKAFASSRGENGAYRFKNAKIMFIREEEILDTGGGLKNALPLIGDQAPVLVHNGDIFFDAPIRDFLNFAEKHAGDESAAATLCLRGDGALRNVAVNGGHIVDMRKTTGAPFEKEMQFTGVFVANPPLLKSLKNFTADKFSIVEAFIEAIKKDSKSIPFFEENRGRWTDIGTPEQYVEINANSAPTLYGRLAELKISGFRAAKTAPITKGGSARDFFRFETPDGEKLIACFYSDEKRENFLYAPIAEFLGRQGFPVPQIAFHDKGKRMLVMTDAGTRDLASVKDNIHLYRQAIRHVKKLHTEISAEFEKSPFELSPQFDEALYDWEQNYFFDECVRGRFALGAERPEREFAEIKRRLLSEKKVLLHRDLQSQNIIVSDSGEDVSFIDFQGMRLGCAYYDLASLLFDPYVSLSYEARGELFEEYENASPHLDCAGKKLFHTAAVERLMQALGAYGFLSSKRGKKEYENYFAPALENLIYCAGHAGLAEIEKLAQSCQEKL